MNTHTKCQGNGHWAEHIIELHPGKGHFQEDVQHQGMRLRFRRVKASGYSPKDAAHSPRIC